MHRAREPFSKALLDELWDLVSLQPEERVQADVERVVRWFRKRVDLLQNISEDDCREILSNCEAFDIAEDDIIIAQGESDSSLYIVLKGRVSVYCNPNQQGVRVTSVIEPPVSLPKSNANTDVSSSLVVPNGGSDSGIGGVGPFFREDASNSGGNAGPSPECRIALLEPPSPASRRSSAYSNSSELIPPLSPTPSDSAYGSLLIPSASPSPSGSAQLKVPRVRKTSVFSGSFDSSLLNPPASTSRRESLQLEVPPIRKNSTCSCSGDSLFNPPTTISRSGSAQLEVPPGTSRRNSLSPRPGLLPSAIRRGRVADLLSPQINTKHRTSVGFERRKSKQSDGASMNGALLNANGAEVWSNGPNLRALNIRRETLGNHVFHYVEAGAFGEVGFVQPDSKRTASVVADEQCFLLRIERADYSRSLLACAAKYLQFEFKQRAAALRESPFFKNCPPALELFVRNSLRPLNVLPHEVIVAEGSPIPGVFFVARNGTRPTSLRMNPGDHSAENKELALLCHFGMFGLAELNLEADAEGQHRALFSYICEESALVFLLSKHNVDVLCRRAPQLNAQLAGLASDWLRQRLTNLTPAGAAAGVSSNSDETEGFDFDADTSDTTAAMNAEQSPSAQQRIAQCVKRLDARVKRLESARVHSPAPASRSAHSESLEDEERKQLVKFYISDRMQLLKPINSDTLKHLVHSEKKRKEWDERLSSLRSEASDRDNQKWHKRRARSRLELQCEKATSIFAGIEEAYRQSSRSQSISAAAASFTNANAPSLPQRPTKPVTNQRHLLPAYMSGNRAENSFTEYDRLVDRLEAQIGARVMAVAREREHFYSMQRHTFESQQDLFLQSQDAVDPVEAALLKFAHAGGNKDPVVEETLLRLVPTCRSLYEKQSARSQKPPATATRAKFDQKTFDREISDQLSVLLVDYLQSDSRVQTALNRFRKFTGDNSSHISGVSTKDLYSSKEMRDAVAHLVDYLWKTPGAQHASHLEESRAQNII